MNSHGIIISKLDKLWYFQQLNLKKENIFTGNLNKKSTEKLISSTNFTAIGLRSIE